MVQASINTVPYAQPYSPIKVGGKRYAVPSDLTEGLRFLKRFLRRTSVIEYKAHLITGNLYALTNNLIVEYEVGKNELPDLSFNPRGIQTLAAFDVSPAYLRHDGDEFCFHWDDGQELYVDASGAFIESKEVFRGNSHYSEYAHDAIDRFWRFRAGVTIDEETQKNFHRTHGGSQLANDVFLNGEEVASRMSSDRKTWTMQQNTPFLANADRPMRFERKAFIHMLRVADEIDFSTSPVCFRHAHGRGMLVERTLGSDVPDFEQFDD